MKSNLVTDTDARKETEAAREYDEPTLQMRKFSTNILETENSQLRASDLNLMTEGVDEKDQSPKLQQQSQMSRNPQNHGLMHFDSTLSGLVLIKEPTKDLEHLVGVDEEYFQRSDARLSDNCRAELGIERIGVEDELINLRITDKKNSKSGIAGPRSSKKSSFQISTQKQTKGISAMPNGPGIVKNPPSLSRQAQSLEPQTRTNGTAGQPVPVAAPAMGRCLGAGSSQPPQLGFQQITSSNERLHFADPSTWKSPMKTTANAGAFSSHLKLAMLHSNQKSNYKDNQRMLLQQKSVRLEDELYQTQTTLRKKEGTHRIQIALLEQQVNQMQQEMSEAKKREDKQKRTYDQILAIINRQLLDADLSQPSYNAILINLNQVQNILNDANKTFSESRVSSHRRPSEPGPGAAPLGHTRKSDAKREAGTKDHTAVETEQFRPDLQRFGEPPQLGKEVLQSKEFYSQIKEKNTIIQTYEQQNRDFIDEISQLQIQICSQKKRLVSLEQENSELEKKAAKLESELQEQREREQKLKALHSDEMKYNADMNAYEQSLFQSKIKELESNLATMQNRIQLWNLPEAPAGGSQVCVCQASQMGIDEKSPRMQLLNRSARFDSQQKGLVKKPRHSANGAACCPEGNGSVQAPQIMSVGSMVTAQSNHALDKECQTEESLFQESMHMLLVGLKDEYEATKRTKNEENEAIRERMCRMQAEREEEMQAWQHQRADLESTISKLKKLMNQHVTNHKGTTDMLKAHLKESQATIDRKEGENKVLKSKLQQIKQQIAKLERIQQGEMSRSRSGSRRAAGFRFGFGRTIDSRPCGPESRYHQSCASSLSPSATVEKKQSTRVTTMLRWHSKTPHASHLQKQKGPSSAESAGSAKPGKRANVKQQLFGSLNLRQQVEDLIKNEQLQTTNLDSVALQDCLWTPGSTLQQSDQILTLRQQLGVLRKSAEMMSRSRSKSGKQGGEGDQWPERTTSGLKARPNKAHNKPEKELTCRQSYLSLGEHRQQNLAKGRIVSKIAHVSQASKENQRQDPPGPRKDMQGYDQPTAAPLSQSNQAQARQMIPPKGRQRAPISRNDIANGRGQMVCTTQPVLAYKNGSEALAIDQLPTAMQTCRLDAAFQDEGEQAGATMSPTILRDGQRQMKANLRARSSSKVKTAKKELAKRLRALPSNELKTSKQSSCAQHDQNVVGGQRPGNVFQDLTNKDGVRCRGASQVSGADAPQGPGETISNAHSSNLNLNLQPVAQEIQLKESIQKPSAEHSQLTSARRPTARHHRHQKSSADFAMSGDFCEWGLSPDGAGSGQTTNRQKMEAYRFMNNQLFSSMCQRNNGGLAAGVEAAESQRGDDSSKAKDEQRIYFGDVSTNKKFITTLRDNNKSSSKGGGRSGPNRTDHSLNRRTGPHRTECSINPLLTFDNNAPSADRKARPSQAEKVNRILTQILSQPQVSQSAYHTQPQRYMASKDTETSISERLEEGLHADTCRQVVEQLEPGISTDRGLEIPGEFTYMGQNTVTRPEMEIALSDGSMRYADGEIRVTEDSSSHISPVKQEAAKATIKDMVKGSPALETRRMRDHYPQKKIVRSPHIRHQSQKDNHKDFNEATHICATNFPDCKSSRGESARTGQTKARDLLKYPESNNQNLNGPKRGMLPSSNSDTSLGSNQQNEDRNVIMRALLEGAPSATSPALNEHQQENCSHGMAHRACTCMDASMNDSPARAPAGANPAPRQHIPADSSEQYALFCKQIFGVNALKDVPPELLAPVVLNQFEELVARILRRDQKVNGLKVKNRGLQLKLEKLEAQYQELLQRFEETQRQKDELLLQNQKFECRLKQAQIILNDPTDRVDLQLNCTGEAEGQAEDHCRRDLAVPLEAQETGRGENGPQYSQLETRKQSRQELLQAKNSISSSIKEIQLRKQQIREAESRQRTAHKHPVSLQRSCSGNSDLQDRPTRSPLRMEFTLPEDQPMREAFATIDPRQGRNSSPMRHQEARGGQQELDRQNPQGNSLNKRASSVNSTAHLRQSQKQVLYPGNSKEAMALPMGSVPKIDLSSLEQQQNQMELGSARWDQPSVFEQLRQQKNSKVPNAKECQSQRGPQLRIRQPPATTLSKLLHGRSNQKQKHSSSTKRHFALEHSSNTQFFLGNQENKEPDGVDIRVASKRQLTASGLGYQVTPMNAQRRQEGQQAAAGSPGQAQLLSQRGFEASRTAAQTSRLLDAVERMAPDRCPSALQVSQNDLPMNRVAGRACDQSSTQDGPWRGESELGNSILSRAASRTGLMRPQGKGTTAGPESAKTQNLTSKSIASTQQTHTRNGGVTASKRSFPTRDSKTSLNQLHPKKHWQHPNNYAVSCKTNHLATKSSESAFSSLAHGQSRPNRQMTQTVCMPGKPADMMQPRPFHQQPIVAAARSRPQLSTKQAQAAQDSRMTFDNAMSPLTTKRRPPMGSFR